MLIQGLELVCPLLRLGLLRSALARSVRSFGRSALVRSVLSCEARRLLAWSGFAPAELRLVGGVVVVVVVGGGSCACRVPVTQVALCERRAGALSERGVAPNPINS